MSNYLEKSGDNMKAAQLLNNKRLYAPAVHCAYYSCILLMKHALVYIMGISEATIDEECRKSKKGIHHYAPNNLYAEIYAKDHEKAGDFMNFINDLKEFRISSDYRDIEVGNSESAKSITLARDINTIIQENMNVKAS